MFRAYVFLSTFVEKTMGYGPRDMDDMPTDELIDTVGRIIRHRNDLCDSGKCPYCGTPSTAGRHTCKYAGHTASFHTRTDKFMRLNLE
jgi:hypothetical protein